MSLEIDDRQYAVSKTDALDADYDIRVTDAALVIFLPQLPRIQEPLRKALLTAIKQTCPNGTEKLVEIPDKSTITHRAKVICKKHDGIVAENNSSQKDNERKARGEATAEKTVPSPTPPPEVTDTSPPQRLMRLLSKLLKK